MRGRPRRAVLLPLAVVGVAVMLPVAVLMGTVVLLGWQLQVIETGSMAPSFPEGSLAVVEPIDPADVRAGMTLVFQDPSEPGRLVAHRAVHRLSGEVPVWQTKGDANATADPLPVHAGGVRGRIRWVVPGLGGMAAALRSSLSPVVLVGVPLGLLAVTELRARGAGTAARGARGGRRRGVATTGPA